MSNIDLLDNSGAVSGSVELKDAWLEREKGEQAVKDVVVAYLAAQRAGTASAKNRSAVRGGGAKPWRQKGTGNARAGSNRSPIWRGGGIIFGPSPRKFHKKVNKKVRQLALKRAFTERVDANEVAVVDQISLAGIKTAEVAKLLKGLGLGENVLIIVDSLDDNLQLSVRNFPKVDVVAVDNINVYQLLLHKKVLLTKAGLEKLGERLA
ncbi:MAG: 50S ribosomal protein L4 [Lentisphaeria bacterium]|nr:50S ribosomal protein L4 [Lentisphaeria bacterium]